MRALVTGITGQDGSYLAEQLLERGDEVWGLTRSHGESRHGLDAVKIITGDLLDADSLRHAIEVSRPEVIFNLAALTTPGELAPGNALVGRTTGMGAFSLLRAAYRFDREIRFVHASSSAIYAPLEYGAYGLAKQFAHNSVLLHRRAGVHASNAILFSHTSPRQSHRFLIRQLVRAAVRMRPGRSLQPLGVMVTNLVNRRDWGWAPDYARALLHVADAEPGDYTVRTGTTQSVQDVFALAALHLNLEPTYFVKPWRQASLVETRFELEPADPAPLPPGWEPSVTFREIIGELVEAELRDNG